MPAFLGAVGLSRSRSGGCALGPQSRPQSRPHAIIVLTMACGRACAIEKQTHCIACAHC